MAKYLKMCSPNSPGRKGRRTGGGTLTVGLGLADLYRGLIVALSLCYAIEMFPELENRKREKKQSKGVKNGGTGEGQKIFAIQTAKQCTKGKLSQKIKEKEKEQKGGRPQKGGGAGIAGGKRKKRRLWVKDGAEDAEKPAEKKKKGGRGRKRGRLMSEEQTMSMLDFRHLRTIPLESKCCWRLQQVKGTKKERTRGRTADKDSIRN